MFLTSTTPGVSKKVRVVIDPMVTCSLIKKIEKPSGPFMATRSQPAPGLTNPLYFNIPDDLPRLQNARELFVNKFHLDYEPLALDCLEQHIWYRTANQIKGFDHMINMTYYQNLPFVKSHVTENNIKVENGSFSRNGAV